MTRSALLSIRVLQGEQRKNQALTILKEIMAKGFLEIILGTNPYIEEVG